MSSRLSPLSSSTSRGGETQDLGAQAARGHLEGLRVRVEGSLKRKASVRPARAEDGGVLQGGGAV